MTNNKHEFDEAEFRWALDNGHAEIAWRMLATPVYSGQPISPLHAAIHLGRADILEAVLATGVDIDAEQYGKPALVLAVELGKIDLVRVLLEHGAKTGPIMGYALRTVPEGSVFPYVQLLAEHGADPNVAQNQGWTPLLYAAWYGDVDTARVLLDHGAIVDAATSAGSTPLIIAAANGRAEVVKRLIERGADIDRQSVGGDCAVLASIRGGHAEIEQLLTDAGAVIPTEFVDIASAVRWRNLSAVRDLIESVTDLEGRGNLGETPLMIAAATGPEYVRAILHAGAAVTPTTPTADDALASAIDAGQEDCVRLLIAAEANPNARYGSGRTPLMRAARAGNHEIVDMLVAAGADIDAWDAKGKTALILAVENDRVDVVDHLVDLGANVLAIDDDMYSAIRYAIYAADPAIIRKLLDTGCILQHPSSMAWRRGFDSAVGGDNIDMVRIFLDHGANPNTIGYLKRSVVSKAIEHGTFETFKLLLDRGADVTWNTVLWDGHQISALDALDAAARSGNTDIVRYFLENGADPNIYLSEKDGGYSTLARAVGSQNMETVRTLIHAGATDGWSDASYENAIQNIAMNGLPLFALKLIEAGANPGEVVYQAARCSDVPLLRWLAAKGFDLHSLANNGRSALMGAVSGRRGKSAGVIQFLLDYGVDVNVVTQNGETALDIAATGNLPAVSTLIDVGASPNGGDREPALIVATKFEQREIVKRLLESGADANRRSDIGDTALRIAKANDLADIRQLIEEYGAIEPSMFDDLHHAILWDNREETVRLIDAGADVEAVNARGMSPLITAVDHNASKSIVLALLDHGADVDRLARRSDGGESAALMQAIGAGNAALTKQLLDRGANPNTADEFRSALESAIDHANQQRDEPEDPTDLTVVRYLLGAGADPNVTSGSHFVTPLSWAAGDDNVELVALLIEHGADLERRPHINHPSRTALIEAACTVSVDAVDLLLRAGADPNARDENGATALIVVCDCSRLYGHTDDPSLPARIVQIAARLIEAGVDVNAVDLNGRSAISAGWACDRIHRALSPSAELIALLLSHGADPNTLDDWGETPLRKARRTGSDALTSLLVASGGR